MRVRAPDHRDVGHLDESFRDVAVHVERAGDRDVGPDDGPDLLGERGIHVGMVLGDRRPVIGDEHAVPRTMVAEHPEHLGGQPVVGVVRDRRERPGLRPHQRYGFEAQVARSLQVARDGVERAVEPIDDLLAAQDVRGLELGVIGRHPRERVGLVGDAEDRESHHGLLWPVGHG